MTAGSFKDHFSGDSGRYARARPDYPDALFAWLAAQAGARQHALDAGCGNGQASRGLARHFRHVTAIDPSAAQIAEAEGPDNVRFLVRTAEDTGLPDRSCDLVLIAQALHWFDHERFFAEAARLLRPGGLLAAIAYDRAETTPEIDAIITHLYSDILGPFWPPERRYFDEGYARSIPFPRPQLDTPAFRIERHWTAAQMLDYCASWSATRRYIEARGTDPLDRIRDSLARIWGAHSRPVIWKIAVLAARTAFGQDFLNAKPQINS
ncbi:MAG: class I SAM-dependent methyltransferase [Rhodothalassiaceae bacterium]